MSVNVTTEIFNQSVVDGYFILPIGYIVAICFPFISNILFKSTNNNHYEHNKTIYANLKNLTKSNNKYYMGNHYTLQLNVTELFEDLILTTDTYEFLKKNFSTESNIIEVEFNNEDSDKTWININKLFELITRDLKIDNLYILVSENSVDFKDLIHKSSSVKFVNILDLYGYLNPKMRKICFRKSVNEDYDSAYDTGIDLFDCEADDRDDVIECSSCDDDETEEIEDELTSKLERTILIFRYMKRNYKNIYTIMNYL